MTKDPSASSEPATDMSHPDVETLMQNMQHLQDLTSRLLAKLADRPPTHMELEAPGPDFQTMASKALLDGMMSDPSKMYAQQAELWQHMMHNTLKAQKAALEAFIPSPANPSADQQPKRMTDRRFANPKWESDPWLGFIRDQYLASSKAVEEMVNGLDGIDNKERQRLAFFSRQIVDMMSPSNFLATNPDALQKAVDTHGQSLIDGMENLVHDLEANDGRLAVTLADPDAFEVGGNIATAPGKVVFRNRMFELIQYSPTTKKVYQTPLVILPPWINKFYILDLKPKNSLIRYAVDQGHTVFVVSWINPDASYASTGFDDYVKEGAIEAIDTVRAITKQKQINAIGYCIGGTLLATTLAWLKQKNLTPVANATFFTTMLDFEDPGEIGVFLDEDFLGGLDQEVERTGYLEGYFMARTFSFMRANDLVYAPAVKSYLMGEAPPAFDLLYWNGDSTNLPAAMAREYLNRLYKNNELMKGEFSVEGDTVALKDINIPVMAIATRTDHIAPWQASFSGISEMSGDVKLLLADSGHIAGIVNPPAAEKYGYWTHDEPFDLQHSQDWYDAATRHEGSWWPVWSLWMAKRSGTNIAARQPGTKDYPALGEAPGTYVAVSAKQQK